MENTRADFPRVREAFHAVAINAPINSMSSNWRGTPDRHFGESVSPPTDKDVIRANSIRRIKEQKDSFISEKALELGQMREQQGRMFQTIAEQAAMIRELQATIHQQHSDMQSKVTRQDEIIKGLQATVESQDAEMQAHLRWVSDLRNIANFGGALDDCRSRLGRLEESNWSAILDMRFADINRQIQPLINLSVTYQDLSTRLSNLEGSKAMPVHEYDVQGRIGSLEESHSAGFLQMQNITRQLEDLKSRCNADHAALRQRVDEISGSSTKQDDVAARLKILEGARVISTPQGTYNIQEGHPAPLESGAEAQIAAVRVDLVALQENLVTAGDRVAELEEDREKLSELAQQMQRLDQSFDQWTEGDGYEACCRAFDAVVGPIRVSLLSLQRDVDSLRRSRSRPMNVDDDGEEVEEEEVEAEDDEEVEDEEEVVEEKPTTSDISAATPQRGRRGRRPAHAAAHSPGPSPEASQMQRHSQLNPDPPPNYMSRGRPRKAYRARGRIAKNALPPTPRRSGRPSKPQQMESMLSWAEARARVRAARRS